MGAKTVAGAIRICPIRKEEGTATLGVGAGDSPTSITGLSQNLRTELFYALGFMFIHKQKLAEDRDRRRNLAPSLFQPRS